MTAVLPEAGQDAAEDPPDPDAHFKALAAALAEVDQCTKQLIVDELAEMWPALAKAEAQAAERLRAATEALEAPQAAVDALAAEIDRVTGQCADWQARLESDQIEDRVEARVRFQAWTDELDKLKVRRDFAESGMLPLFDARNKARGDLELAHGAKRGLAWACVAPFETAVGQATRAYVGHRQPRLNFVLLGADQDHPEWECACAELRELCISAMRGGYDITRDLPDFREVAYRQMTAAMPSAESAVSDPAPSAAEITAQVEVDMGNLALAKASARDVVEDRRPAYRQHVPSRPSMRVQTLRDLGVR